MNKPTHQPRKMSLRKAVAISTENGAKPLTKEELAKRLPNLTGHPLKPSFLKAVIHDRTDFKNHGEGRFSATVPELSVNGSATGGLYVCEPCRESFDSPHKLAAHRRYQHPKEKATAYLTEAAPASPVMARTEPEDLRCCPMCGVNLSEIRAALRLVRKTRSLAGGQ